jgi:hypothetical protein
MSRKKKIKFYEYIIVFGLFLSFVNVIRYFPGGVRFYVNDIKSSYKGVIVDKYSGHSTHLKIDTGSNKYLDVATLCDSLWEESAVGDSIEKMPDDNYVILKKKGRTAKLLYKYIPANIRNDDRWPGEWKNKWMDATR